MDEKSLQAFCVLAATCHFTQAAEQLYMSPSTLSRLIKRLEQRLRQQLFIRNNRQVRLTVAGEQLLPVARDMLQQWQSLASRLQQEKAISGTLRLFCSVTASYRILPALLGHFQKRHPAVELKIRTGDPARAVSLVNQRQVDIAIAARPAALPDNIWFQAMGHIPLLLVAPRSDTLQQDWQQPDTIAWQKLPFIIPEAGMGRQIFQRWCEDMAVSPTIYATVEGHEAILSLVALGLGVGICPQEVLLHSPVRDKVRTVPLPRPLMSFELGLCCLKSRRDTALIQAFWQAMPPLATII